MKLLELVNVNTQNVISLGTLNLGTVKHRVCYGAFNFNNSDTVTLVQPGWYYISVKADLTSTVASQPMVLALFANGVLVPETETNVFATAEGTQTNVSFTKIAKVCVDQPIALTLVNTSSANIIYDDLIVDIIKVN